MGDVTVLDRPMFRATDAARLLRMPPRTLDYWLEGAKRGRRDYAPVIRSQRSGSKLVTWGEFVEAGLLRQYRRVEHVPLHQLRHFIELMREKTGVPYPLAHARPYVGVGRRLLLDAQTEAGLDEEFALVATVDGQTVLLPPSEAFMRRVVWEGDEPTAWRPHDEERSPVLMVPAVKSGQPTVKGIRTEIIWEHIEGGEAFDEVAEEFGLTGTEVRMAHAWETSLRAGQLAS